MVHGEIEVTNGPPIIESLVAIPASGDRGTVTTIARFVDSTGDLHTATVDFGDGTVVEAIVLTYDPVTGRFEAPVYPGTTEIVTFIDPVTGDRVPLVDPVSGEFNLGGLVDPATGRMAPLHDPATGGTTTSYAVLDASTRQVFATHRYSASSDYEITITVSDEEEAAADEVVDYRSFEASLGTPRPPIDIIPALERQGFDLSRLTGGSGIFGERIAAGVFGGVGFDREGFVDLAIFAGRAAPGGIITVSFYNELGDLVGFEEVSVDSRGYWMLQVDGILLDPGKNGIRGIEVSKGFLPDGRIDAQRYDFRIDSAIEDALREHFQIGESPSRDGFSHRWIVNLNEKTHDDFDFSTPPTRRSTPLRGFDGPPARARVVGRVRTVAPRQPLGRACRGGRGRLLIFGLDPDDPPGQRPGHHPLAGLFHPRGSTTRFVQPSGASAVLNRVTGGNPSAIHGTLSANGQVYLINPNGILVGSGGVVDTAGFLASTLDVSDAAFLRGGDLRFSGNSKASVVNLGRIGASEGDVILIARTVENHGEIHAPNGTAALAAGSEVLVKASGEERVFIIEAGNASEASSATQAGLIAAAAAEIKAAGGNEYALAIKHTGVTRPPESAKAADAFS
jgi:filamentous hemagglutinin family protein